MKTRYTAGAALSDAAIQGLHARIMSHEFEGLDATEKAGIESTLNRCRRLAAQIESELRLPPPHSRTSLARATNTSDKETPSDAAVFRLTAM
jgi:hypothetical protein